MVRGRSTPVILGGHFHVTRFGMFRSRAGPSTQPLVNGSQSTTAYRHRPFLHTQGVIRTAPPSRSRVKNDYSLIGMLSRGKYPSPLVGEGRVRGYPSSGSMLKRISPPSPTKGRRNTEPSCADLIRASPSFVTPTKVAIGFTH